MKIVIGSYEAKTKLPELLRQVKTGIQRPPSIAKSFPFSPLSRKRHSRCEEASLSGVGTPARAACLCLLLREVMRPVAAPRAPGNHALISLEIFAANITER